MFFIESGQVSILVPLRNGAHPAHRHTSGRAWSSARWRSSARRRGAPRSTRIRKSGAGSSKPGIFGGIADEAPLLKIAVLQNLARDMAGRLRGANEWIAALA